RLAGVLGPALTNASVARPADIKVYALRVSASLFGHNTPAQPLFADPDNKGKVSGFDYPNLGNTWGQLVAAKENFPTIALDAEYDQIQPNSWMLIEWPPFGEMSRSTDHKEATATGPKFAGGHTMHIVKSTAASTLAALGVSSKVTLPTISPAWFEKASPEEMRIATGSTLLLRGTRVYAQSELLPPAEVPITDPVC